MSGKKYRQMLNQNGGQFDTYSVPVTVLGSTNLNTSLTASGGPYTYTSSWDNSIKPNTVNIKGDAEFHGNISWQGRDMREWFESVESRLALLQPNPELEKDWEELAQLRMQYMELERNIIAKQKVFDIIKKT